MNPIQIAVINESTVVPQDEFRKVIEALQHQVTEHYAPVWGTDAVLSLALATDTFHTSPWQLIILDDSDQAGALGYHDLTKEGLPLGKVFAKTDKTYGTQWSVSASHELLEMLGDPLINMCVMGNSYMGNGLSQNVVIAYENCDPCEADGDGYLIDGVLVSDFVFPSWFNNTFVSPQYDYLKKITKPFQILPGGYMQILQLNNSAGWQQMFGDKGMTNFWSAEAPKRSMADRAQIGSRRERRRIAREQWQVSMR